MTDMTRTRRYSIALGAACLLATGLVLAIEPEATLHEVQGTVLVNQGKQYIAGHSGMSLQRNARVVVMDGASAVVKQAGGSVTRLGSNSLFTLGQSTVQQFAYTQAFNGVTTSGGGETVAASEATGPNEEPLGRKPPACPKPPMSPPPKCKPTKP